MGDAMTNNTLPTGEMTEAVARIAGFLDLTDEIGLNNEVVFAYRGTELRRSDLRALLAMRKAATPEQDGLVERARAADDCSQPIELDPRDVLAMHDHIESQAAQIAELRRELDEAQRRDERVREAMFVLSDRLNLIGALDSDNVHAAYEKVVAALTNNGGENA